MFYINSKWYAKSGGQGLLHYYENTFFDANHLKIENNTLMFDSFYCKLEGKEFGRPINSNSYTSTLQVEINDKLGEKMIRLFNMTNDSKNRFDEIFKYLKIIKMYGTHSAANKIIELEYAVKKTNQVRNKNHTMVGILFLTRNIH